MQHPSSSQAAPKQHHTSTHATGQAAFEPHSSSIKATRATCERARQHSNNNVRARTRVVYARVRCQRSRA
eukprot:2095649-Lingulodinium_polyedra.AAC.1